MVAVLHWLSSVSDALDGVHAPPRTLALHYVQ